MLGNDKLKDKRPSDTEREDCSVIATFKSDGPYWGTETRGIIMFDGPEKDAFIRFLFDEYTEEERKYLNEQEAIRKSLSGKPEEKKEEPKPTIDFNIKLTDLSIVGSIQLSARLDKIISKKLVELLGEKKLDDGKSEGK